MHDDHRKQFTALCVALLAVALFACFEHGLTDASKLTTIDFYVAFRVVVTGVMFFALLAGSVLRRGTGCPALVLNPLALGSRIWARAVITLVYQAALAIALAMSGTQAMTYPLFLLHPLWQLLAHRMIAGRWPNLSGRIVGLAMIIAGIVVFAFCPATSGGTGHTAGNPVALLLAQLAALAAGAGFAFTNEYGSIITASKRSDALRKVAAGSDRMSSLELSAYTTYASFWLLPLMLPLIMVVLQACGLASMASDTPTIHDGRLIVIMTMGCAIITLGTWLFAEAFRRATKGPQVAALDALILPIGIGLDLWSQKLSPDSAAFPQMMVAAVLIVGGVAWSALRERC